jgi:hypothetical protein
VAVDLRTKEEEPLERRKSRHNKNTTARELCSSRGKTVFGGCFRGPENRKEGNLARYKRT